MPGQFSCVEKVADRVADIVINPNSYDNNFTLLKQHEI